MTSRGVGSEGKEDDMHIDGKSERGNEGPMDCCRWIKSAGQILPLQRSNQVIVYYMQVTDTLLKGYVEENKTSFHHPKHQFAERTLPSCF